MAHGTQEIIDGLQAGRIAIDALCLYATRQLQGMADLGATKEYVKLRDGFVRLTELSAALKNLYSLLELEGQPGLWRPGKGRANPKL